MKLLRCYIENFGRLHQYAVEFQPGMTVIKEPNGFGKTTLATFLRCMFYGLPRGNKNALDKDLRRKYTPWQGGRFGGNLEFELEGREYRVERTFGERPSQDTFALYEQPGLRRSRKFSKNIGVELFGLDAESFERSTYMPQLRESGPLSTGSIQAKLSNLVEDSQDINRYEKAVEALRKARSAYIPYRGNGGSVEQAGRNITRLRRELEDCRQAKERLSEEARQLTELERQIRAKNGMIDDTQRRIAQVSGAEARRAIGREYQGLLDQKGELERAARQIADRYPKGLPGEEELTPVSRALDQLAAAAQEDAGAQAREEALELLRRQESKFAGGIPTQEELDACQAACDDYISLTARLQGSRLSQEEQRELQRLERFFQSGVPALEQLKDCQRRLSKAAALRRENSRLAAGGLTDSPEAQPGYGKPWGVLPCFLGGVFAVLAGIILLIARRYALGGVLLGVGALCLMGAVYLNLRKLIADNGSGQATRLNPGLSRRIQANQAAAEQEEQRVQSFVAQYMGPACGGQEGLNQIQSNLVLYLSLEEKRAGLTRQTEQLRGRRDGLAEQLRAFLGRYYQQVPLEKCGRLLADLRTDCAAFRQGKETVERFAARENQLEAASGWSEQTVEQFFHKYELTPMPRTRGSLQAIRDDLRTARELKTRYQRVMEQLKRFMAEHGTDFAPEEPEEAASIEGLKLEVKHLSGDVQALNQTLAEQRQRLARLQEQADRIPDLSDQLDSWREKRDAGRKKAETLDKTIAYLEQARQSLSETYLDKIKQSFVRYLNQLLPEEDGSGVFVSQELEVSLERRGQVREPGYFSAGVGDLVKICMRLALIDGLFQEEKPFLILDDPFVNLDDENTARALTLLRKLGDQRQILYLVCNSSRC